MADIPTFLRGGIDWAFLQTCTVSQLYINLLFKCKPKILSERTCFLGLYESSGISNFKSPAKNILSKNLVKTHLCALCTVLRALHLMIILLRMSGIISWPPDFVNSLLYLLPSSENVGNNVSSIKVIRPYFITLMRDYKKARSHSIS